jgi:hypothetical protein
MTQDEIIEMAKQSGIWESYPDSWSLEKFAKLVADKTRQELREEIVYTWVPPHFVDIAVETEREAIIDLVAMYGGPVDLEAAIRARGEV